MCTLPHGQASVAALIFSILAFSFSMSASVPCYYLTVTNSYYESINLGLFTYTSAEIGTDGLYYKCVPWSQTDWQSFDAAWKTAVSFAIIGNIATGISMIAAIIMTFMTFSRSVILALVGFQVLACFSELLTFVAFASSICNNYNNCKISTSAGLALAASLVSFIAAMLFNMIPPGREFIPGTTIFTAEPPGTVTVQKTVNPDGTKKTVKTTVNADGSKTVQETVEQPQV